MVSAFFGSVIESVEAIASPPAFLTASTVSCAGPLSLPAPCKLAPISQAITRAPSLASSSAMPRPIPRPAPVTMATFPFTISDIRCPAREAIVPLAPAKAGTQSFCYSAGFPLEPAPAKAGPGMSGLSLAFAPHLAGDFDDHAQLRPLLVLGQRIALFGRGKAALRRQTQLFERNEFGGLVNTALDFVLGLESSALRRNETEHGRPILREHPQRFEAAGTFAVVFHEEAMHLDSVKQDLLHGFVASAPHVGRFIVATTHVHRDGHVGRNVRHRRIDKVAVEFAELLRIIPTVFH